MHGLARQGANRSDSLCYREDSQRRMASSGAEFKEQN
jgi:hypothetical protein